MSARRLIAGLVALAAAAFGGSFALGQATSSEPAHSDTRVNPVSQALGDLRAASAQIDQFGGVASLPDLKVQRKAKRAGALVLHAATHAAVRRATPHVTALRQSHGSSPSPKSVSNSTPVSSPRTRSTAGARETNGGRASPTA